MLRAWGSSARDLGGRGGLQGPTSSGFGKGSGNKKLELRACEGRECGIRRVGSLWFFYPTSAKNLCKGSERSARTPKNLDPPANNAPPLTKVMTGRETN